MNFRRVVATYVINDNYEFLMLEHKRLGAWLPPGGHVEQEELVHQAAEREVKEETGLDIDFLYDSSSLCQKINISTNDRGEKINQRAKILPQPLLVQLEDVGDHFQEDFVYLAKAKSSDYINLENHNIGWFNIDDALNLSTFENVKMHLNYLRDKLNIRK